MSIIEASTSQDLENIRNNFQGPFVIDFYAEWCAPCKMMMPYFEQLADECSEKATFIKVNAEQGDLSQTFKIRGVPTFVVLGQESSEPLLTIVGMKNTPIGIIDEIKDAIKGE